MQAACNEIGECPVGNAVLTDGFELQAKKIIHTVGPIWKGGTANEENLLTDCYKNSLALAVTHGYESIAFRSFLPVFTAIQRSKHYKLQCRQLVSF